MVWTKKNVLPEHYSKDLKDLVASMLDPDPKSRYHKYVFLIIVKQYCFIWTCNLYATTLKYMYKGGFKKISNLIFQAKN